ncbi:MAG: iron-sulfur cluster assembly scaffold protein [candidate division Zixibacteria bacterium]|nr:iron-sulfur cluster assembly scaffold protein [Candidatus Tariuqbacter arcticus]
MALQYTEKVIEHFTNPQNVGEIEGADAQATEGSPACGDMVTFSLKINPETHIIEDVKFRSYGCASNIATASMATTMAKGKTIEEVKELGHKLVAEALGGLPAVKMHCSVLAMHGLKSAIKQWEIERGLFEEENIVLNEKTVKKLLRSVIHPQTGENIVKMGLMKWVKIDGDKVFVEISMGDTDSMFADNIYEETVEALEKMKCCGQALVKVVSNSGKLLKDNGDVL